MWYWGLTSVEEILLQLPWPFWICPYEQEVYLNLLYQSQRYYTNNQSWKWQVEYLAHTLGEQECFHLLWIFPQEQQAECSYPWEGLKYCRPISDWNWKLAVRLTELMQHYTVEQPLGPSDCALETVLHDQTDLVGISFQYMPPVFH